MMAQVLFSVLGLKEDGNRLEYVVYESYLTKPEALKIAEQAMDNTRVIITRMGNDILQRNTILNKP